ncbi:protein-histidine N-methyltransferase [Sporobolomyces salmoneus]|uniref:protein-histidine N-methyltransferase n=1 Tax=Sporobolomyces salmoneus TaxID=183962 RepID=UPI00317CB9FC
MSFSFAFEIEELDDQLDLASLNIAATDTQEPEQPIASTSSIPHATVALSDLLATLPPLLSYTPVQVPVSSHPDQPITLLRRDLFDARFQILNQDESPDSASTDKGKQKEEEQFIDESSDLVKGVYEGGLKTWECSFDLVDCFDQTGYSPNRDLDVEKVRGKSILEVGCGTAVPSCALFSRLLNEIQQSPTPQGEKPKKRTRIHLQDYNKQVLSLITLPNLLLTYAHHVIVTRAASIPAPDADEEESATPAAPQFKGPGELDVTPEFLESFEALLEHEGIDLEFSEGDWSGMSEGLREKGEEGFDIVLTSETVYSLPSLPSLLDLLEGASKLGSLCLVACKRIYFGVGGGELEFRRRVEKRGGKVESVWGEGTGKGKSEGVGRTVLKVEWKN